MAKVAKTTGYQFHARSENGYYVFGRVLLDLEYVIRSRILPADSPLGGMPRSILVEMYDHVSDEPVAVDAPVGFSGALVDKPSFTDEWPVYGNKPVLPEELEFPQALVGYMHDKGECAFLWGEIQIPLPFKSEWLYNVKVYLTRHSIRWWPEDTLGALGHMDKVVENYRHAATLATTDLRFNPALDQIEPHLPFDCRGSYFKAQRAMGLNIGRLLDI
jgi:hypothetical protein